MFEMRKLFLFLAAGVICMAVAPAGFAVNIVTNGDFATNANGWAMFHVDAADYFVVDQYLSGVGYPAGSVKLERSQTNPAVATNGHRYYQFIPVDPNTSYVVRGQWKGDLAAGATGGNWAEVYIGFTADANTGEPSWANIRRFRKSWDGINNVNISSSGQWNWENFSTSPAGTPVESYTSQAGQNYMVIAFNLGGNVLNPGTAQPYVIFDNIRVVACASMSPADVDMDCVVDFKDMSAVVSQWLSCNLDPASSCW